MTSAVLLCMLPAFANADIVRAAVASNFAIAMEPLVAEFELQSDHEVIVSYGSTGKHFAQLVNGAPFDLFLAADSERARRLEESGVGIAGTRFVYALGTLVLWGIDPALRVEDAKSLEQLNIRFLAMANPRTAPYGLAAEQFLKHIGQWENLQSRIVRGENVSQAYSFVRSGNADMGFIALSQARHAQGDNTGWYWQIPSEYHDPIEQQAIRLNDSRGAVAFLEFLRGAKAREIITANGYSVP